MIAASCRVAADTWQLGSMRRAAATIVALLGCPSVQAKACAGEDLPADAPLRIGVKVSSRRGTHLLACMSAFRDATTAKAARRVSPTTAPPCLQFKPTECKYKSKKGDSLRIGYTATFYSNCTQYEESYYEGFQLTLGNGMVRCTRSPKARLMHPC